jgi:hypothetical protein
MEVEKGGTVDVPTSKRPRLYGQLPAYHQGSGRAVAAGRWRQGGGGRAVAAAAGQWWQGRGGGGRSVVAAVWQWWRQQGSGGGGGGRAFKGQQGAKKGEREVEES